MTDSILAKRRSLTGVDKMICVHELEIEQKFMRDTVNNLRRVEIVRDDLRYQVGHDLLLRGVVYDTSGKVVYTGEWILAHITYITHIQCIQGLRTSWMALSISVITYGVADNWKSFPAIHQHLYIDSV
jgi:hypothetical protein